ncbi:DNA-binding protein [Methylobacterium oryzae CBMB20]
MVTENDVRAAASRIRARPAPPGSLKERVSVRSIRKELGGGSFGDIAKPLAKWKADEGYHPAIERADLPEVFEQRLAALARDLLEQARMEATRERLSDFAEVERRRRAHEEILAEAAAQVDHLEDKIAALQSELDRLRAAGGTTPAAGLAAPTAIAGPPAPEAAAARGFVDAAMGKKLAREADAFWAEVRDAVEAAMRERGPMPVHAIYRALPASLRRRGESVGLPLTPGWLRYHLLRMVAAGEGLAEIDGRFGLAGTRPAPEAEPPGEAHRAGEVAEMGKRRFWRRFVHAVHDLLAKAGPLTAEEILDRMDPAWVGASERFQRITPGRLRYKLRGRIDEGRPFEELPDERFAAVRGDRPWDGESAMPGRAGHG